MSHSHSSSAPRPADSLFWSVWQRLLVAGLVLLPLWMLLFWSMS
ncbi:hypothetical protein [Tolumonas osonensis]|uniref:Uncharacterized protein n=1 Tax=Tolumonas osonensis TaxID=675874 RepID=A0A841GSG2_9GAMM|nr:hypothetical protein [Tolumonas osonensis]MBB6056733.1 hypothetical protein [Tolumonas osonensis]